MRLKKQESQKIRTAAVGDSPRQGHSGPGKLETPSPSFDVNWLRTDVAPCPNSRDQEGISSGISSATEAVATLSAPFL